MPTTRDGSLCRILPAILAIPSLALVAVTGYGSSPAPVRPPAGSAPHGVEQRGFPVDWGDEFLRDALPASFPDDDESCRKLRVVRLAVGFENQAKRGIPASFDSATTRLAVDSLMDSLLLGRPPPAGSRCA